MDTEPTSSVSKQEMMMRIYLSSMSLSSSMTLRETAIQMTVHIEVTEKFVTDGTSEHSLVPHSLVPHSLVPQSLN